MPQALLITLRCYDGRYHGAGDWPPSPARLFQALLAGSARGSVLSIEDRAALGWLEALPPPEIAAPRAFKGQRYINYVPNNDLDAVGGDPRRIDKIRTEKVIRPYVFSVEIPFLYAWRFDPGEGATLQADRICTLAERLYQFGRGIDMAWAWGEVLDDSEIESRLNHHVGAVYCPAQGGKGVSLGCPLTGSLKSLEDRFAAIRKRFSKVGEGKDVGTLFSQAPKPRFRAVAYNSPPAHRLFDLRTTLKDSPFIPWPLTRTSELVVRIRDKAVTRLKQALPQRSAEIERVLIGRDATEADKAARLRIVPLPSVGHQHADRAIRRVLLEIPPGCPIDVDDLAWAFSGLVVTENVDLGTGEILGDIRLISADEQGMLRHYGVEMDEGSRIWRTVTPAALPEKAARRRIDPQRSREEAKGGQERAREQHAAATAVLQALRHAVIDTPADTTRVQREPFDAGGARVEAFAAGTRFAKERLWHIEIAFAEPVMGPLILGDGRYLGLGLMAPVPRTEGVHCFAIIDGLTDRSDPVALAQALRRAVMSRVQDTIGKNDDLPAFFTGHEPNGAPARGGIHAHLAFAADLPRRRLLLIAPHVLEGRESTYAEREHLKVLYKALGDFRELRAGPSGLLNLTRLPVHVEDDPLFTAARVWESVTDYHPTRYGKRMAREEALANDVRSEILRRGIARPTDIAVVDFREGPRGGLAGRLRLHFATAVSGLILIGRTRHVGGGLFSAAER